MSSTASPASEVTPLRWFLHTVDRSGFTFGLDAVTPVGFRIIHTRRVPRAYRVFELPEPDGPAYLSWLKSHRNRTLCASVLELRQMVSQLRSTPAAASA